jgi:hypothetical protein
VKSIHNRRMEFFGRLPVEYSLGSADCQFHVSVGAPMASTVVSSMLR